MKHSLSLEKYLQDNPDSKKDLIAQELVDTTTLSKEQEQQLIETYLWKRTASFLVEFNTHMHNRQVNGCLWGAAKAYSDAVAPHMGKTFVQKNFDKGLKALQDPIYGSIDDISYLDAYANSPYIGTTRATKGFTSIIERCLEETDAFSRQNWPVFIQGFLRSQKIDDALLGGLIERLLVQIEKDLISLQQGKGPTKSSAIPALYEIARDESFGQLGVQHYGRQLHDLLAKISSVEDKSPTTAFPYSSLEKTLFLESVCYSATTPLEANAICEYLTKHLPIQGSRLYHERSVVHMFSFLQKKGLLQQKYIDIIAAVLLHRLSFVPDENNKYTNIGAGYALEEMMKNKMFFSLQSYEDEINMLMKKPFSTFTYQQTVLVSLGIVMGLVPFAENTYKKIKGRAAIPTNLSTFYCPYIAQYEDFTETMKDDVQTIVANILQALAGGDASSSRLLKDICTATAGKMSIVFDETLLETIQQKCYEYPDYAYRVLRNILGVNIMSNEELFVGQLHEHMMQAAKYHDMATRVVEETTKYLVQHNKTVPKEHNYLVKHTTLGTTADEEKLLSYFPYHFRSVLQNINIYKELLASSKELPYKQLSVLDAADEDTFVKILQEVLQYIRQHDYASLLQWKMKHIFPKLTKSMILGHRETKYHSFNSGKDRSICIEKIMADESDAARLVADIQKLADYFGRDAVLSFLDNGVPQHGGLNHIARLAHCADNLIALCKRHEQEATMTKEAFMKKYLIRVNDPYVNTKERTIEDEKLWGLRDE